jgi:hypothetical protein
MTKIKISTKPLKMVAPRGAEGQALINNNASGLRQDNLYVPNEIKPVGEVFNMPSRLGWDSAVISNGKVVNIVSKSYGHLPNQEFFSKIEQKLKEKDINVLTRSINRDDRAFASDYILADERYSVLIKNGMDKIRPMISFTNSYDGSTKTQGHFGFFREICNNGLHVSTSKIGFSVRHRGNIVEIVVPEIELLLERFMDNEFYEIKKKFEVLAETPIKNIKDYVKMVCHETEIFKFEKSDENESPSKNAELVIEIMMKEAKKLKEEANLFLGYNAFNNLLNHKLKKSFNNQYDWDSKMFDFHMNMATN